MHHLAIMNKSWKLIPKIISGEKKIESRWYKSKVAPWNRIQAGDIVYFKDAGEAVTAKAEVEKVLQFENYDELKMQEIINQYYSQICFRSPPEKVIDWAKEKKHCILIFLKNPSIIEPFKINKTGFGNACAWICVEDIEKIRI